MLEFSFISENNINLIQIGSIGWETEIVNLKIDILDNHIFNFYVDAERIEDCCSHTEYNENTLTDSQSELDKSDRGLSVKSLNKIDLPTPHKRNNGGIFCRKFSPFCYLSAKRKSNRISSRTAFILTVSKHMKIISRIYTLFFLLLSSFMIGQNEIELSKFQNILGKVNYDELSLITLDFENSILKDTYPTLTTEKAYKQFLIDIKNNDASYWNKISPEIKERFNQSNLRLEIYEFPDSVWIEGQDIYSRYILKNDDGTVAKNEDGTIDYGVSFHSTKNIKNIDSLVKAEYKHSRFKYSGQFFKALKSIKNNSTFLKNITT